MNFVASNCNKHKKDVHCFVRYFKLSFLVAPSVKMMRRKYFQEKKINLFPLMTLAMKLLIKRRPPNSSQCALDALPPNAQMHAHERARHAVIILIKKTVHAVNIGQPTAFKIVHS